jgi:hypothetical protein
VGPTVARTDRDETFNENVTIKKDLDVYGELKIIDGDTASSYKSETVEIADSILELNTDATVDAWGGTYVYRGRKDDGTGSGLISKSVVWNPSVDAWGVADVSAEKDGSGANVGSGVKPGTFQQLWHEGNDGPGSGLDADTVDGYEGSDLAVLSEDETVTGQWTFNSNTGLGGETNPSYALDVAGVGRMQTRLRTPEAQAEDGYNVSTLGGSGWVVRDNVGAENKSQLYSDEIVANTFRVAEFLVNQITFSESEAISAGVVARDVTNSGGGTYTFSSDTTPTVAKNDLLRAKRYTDGSHDSKVRVTSVDQSAKIVTVELMSGDAPADGFQYARIGNTTNTDRQNLIYLTASDTSNPRIDFYEDISAFSEFGASALTTRVGNLDGLSKAQASGMGVFTEQLRATDDVLIGTLDKNGAYIEASGGSLYISNSVQVGGTPAQDVESTAGAQDKADAAEDSAKTAAQGYADAAESAAESYADGLDSDVRSELNSILDDALTDGTTLIQGGYLKNDFIQTDAIAVGDFSDDGTYTTPSEAQSKADSAESSAKSHADGLDSDVRSELNTILDSALANGTTLISGGYLKNDFIQTDAIAVGDFSDDGTYTTPSEAQSKADSAESSAKTYADDSIDSLGSLADLDEIQDTTYIKGGLIDTGLLDADAVTAEKMFIESTMTSSILAEDATIEGTLDMGVQAQGTWGKIKMGSGGNAFWLGDFNLQAQNSESSTLFSSDLYTSNGSKSDGPKSYTFGDSTGGRTLIISINADLYANSDNFGGAAAEATVTAELYDSNGNKYDTRTSSNRIQVSGGDNGSGGVADIVIDASSALDSVKVYREVSAFSGDNSSSNAEIKAPIVVTTSTSEDFFGPQGGVWRRGGTPRVAFDVTGGAFAASTPGEGTVIADNHTTWSDKRIKEYIQPLHSPLEKIRGLRPTSYRRKGSTQAHLGFVAQEVQEAVPTAVRPGGPEERWAYNPTELLAPIVGAVQVVDEKATELERRVGALETRMDSLTAKQ